MTKKFIKLVSNNKNQLPSQKVDTGREIHEIGEKLTEEIRISREVAHKELMEFRDEIMGELLSIKDYLFTKLTSDIKTVVMECFAEKGI